MVVRELLPPKVRARFAAVLARLGSTGGERVVSLLMAACVAAGVFFRARGFLFDVPAFWLDESVWAMHLTERPLWQNMIRPPGFILVSKGLAITLGPTEMVLRALPWVAGIAATLASPAFARRFYASPTSRLLFVAVLALNPCAIDFSKEFKPYSIGLLLHFALMLLALRYLESKTARDLGLVLGTATVGCLFTQDLVFAFPGLFVVLGWEALKGRREHLPWVLGAAAVVLLLLLGQYLFMWRYLPKDGAEYWGSKYNVFYTGKGGLSGYFSWSFERYRDMTGLPGIRRDFWQNGGITFEQRQSLRTADRVVWLSMHLMGLMVVVWRQRWREGLLVVMPLLVLWLFNGLGHWPMGAFRTNVFTVVYMTAIAAMAFDVPGEKGWQWLSLLPTVLLVFLPIAVFEKVWHARKQAFTYDSKMPRLMERLVEIGKEKTKAPLILDRRSCDPWRFYQRFHPDTSAQLSLSLDESYEIRCLKNDANIPRELLARATVHEAVWIVLHVGHGVDKMLRAGRLYPLYRISRFEVGPHTVMSFRKRYQPELELEE